MRIDAAAYQLMFSICDGHLRSTDNRATQQNLTAHHASALLVAIPIQYSVLSACLVRTDALQSRGCAVRSESPMQGTAQHFFHSCYTPSRSGSTVGETMCIRRGLSCRPAPNLTKGGQVLPSPVRPPSSCASDVIVPALSLDLPFLDRQSVVQVERGIPPGRNGHGNVESYPCSVWSAESKWYR